MAACGPGSPSGDRSGSPTSGGGAPVPSKRDSSRPSSPTLPAGPAAAGEAGWPVRPRSQPCRHGGPRSDSPSGQSLAGDTLYCQTKKGMGGTGRRTLTAYRHPDRGPRHRPRHRRGAGRMDGRAGSGRQPPDASLPGVAPFARDSGALKGGRHIGGGRRRPTDVLSMAALSASRCAPDMRVFHQRLRERGKPH